MPATPRSPPGIHGMPGDPATTRPAALPAHHPSRSLRFALWVVPIALTLTSPLIPLIVRSPHADLGADAVALGALTLMLILLATTPADAIKLPRTASWILITIGTAWIVGMRIAPPALSATATTTTTTGAVRNTIAGALLIGSFYAAIVLLAIGIAAGAKHLFTILHPPERHALRASNTTANPSPWRTALYAWHPAFPLVALYPIGSAMSERAVSISLVAAMAMLVAAIAADDAVRDVPRWRRPLALFLLSGALIIGSRLWT